MKIKPIHQFLLLNIPLGFLIIWAIIAGIRSDSPMILVLGMMTLFIMIYIDQQLISKIKIQREVGRALVCPNCGKSSSLNYVLKKREIGSQHVTDTVLSQCKFCSYRSIPFQVSFELTPEHTNFEQLPYQQRMLINKTSYEAWFYKVTGIRRR